MPIDPKEGTIPERLRKAYGKMVPEGDNWSWEFEVDPLANEAARRIEELEGILHRVAVARRGDGPDVDEAWDRLPDEIENLWQQVDG